VLVQSDLANLRLGFMVAGDAKPAKPGQKPKAAASAMVETPVNSPFPQGFHRYTLDRFVVGPSSQLAFAAANAVVESHGKPNSSLNMNPLFVYGGSGLGKTHLMIGIGKGLLAKNPALKVAYLKVDNFFNELTIAIRAKNTEPMRKKYQQNDVLLLDDVQTLGKMERTQEEIFYILEYLLQYGKQIVITSDKPPQKLEGLHDRLITRCKWGLTADIQPPDFETRVAILRKKLEDEVFKDLPEVGEEVITFIAHKAKGSVRDLEGLLTRVVFQSSFLGVSPSLEVAQLAFQGLTGNEASASISMERICRMTAETYNISFNDLMKKKSRQQEHHSHRQAGQGVGQVLAPGVGARREVPAIVGPKAPDYDDDRDSQNPRHEHRQGNRHQEISAPGREEREYDVDQARAQGHEHHRGAAFVEWPERMRRGHVEPHGRSSLRSTAGIRVRGVSRPCRSTRALTLPPMVEEHQRLERPGDVQGRRASLLTGEDGSRGD